MPPEPASRTPGSITPIAYKRGLRGLKVVGRDRLHESRQNAQVPATGRDANRPDREPVGVQHEQLLAEGQQVQQEAWPDRGDQARQVAGELPPEDVVRVERERTERQNFGADDLRHGVTGRVDVQHRHRDSRGTLGEAGNEHPHAREVARGSDAANAHAALALVVTDEGRPDLVGVVVPGAWRSGTRLRPTRRAAGRRSAACASLREIVVVAGVDEQGAAARGDFLHDPKFDVITGVPQASDSATGSPKPSLNDGNTVNRAAR